MAFELFTSDKIVPRGEAMVSITSYGRISLNKPATIRYEQEKVEYIQLLWDEESRKIGIRAAPKAKGSFRLSYGTNGNGASFSAVTFLTYIRYDWAHTKSFPLSWDAMDHMFVWEVDAGLVGKGVPLSHVERLSSKIKRAKEGREKATQEAPENEGATVAE